MSHSETNSSSHETHDEHVNTSTNHNVHVHQFPFPSTPNRNDNASEDANEQLPEAKKTKKRPLEGTPFKLSMSMDDLPIPPHLHRQPSIKKQCCDCECHTEHDAWPFELILVRHGQSEGNEAVARSKRGDLSAYTPEFRKKHSSSYRLTDKGIEQAKVAGKWIRENIGDRFDRYYTSEYVRAMESASLLGLPDAKWYTEIVLRERDKGLLDNVSWIERKEKYNDEMERRKRDSFFWCPPGGESLAHICMRIDHTFNTLRRECSNKRVIIVCHGEVMWAFRVRLERLSQIRFHQLQNSKDPRDAIHNCQILHYTRIHPQTGEVFPYFRFMRSVCPWKPEYSTDWLEFERPVYSNDELLASVNTVPKLVNNLEPVQIPGAAPAPEKQHQEEVDF
eukprot:CAMPEP_0168547362 /NCGR_PEP_ID=MMETSP0413-20121227/3993_1 /TAXON_ID=136452 /ORGANISM="Filamoeba nolandi, Strain NC-AS-23-1" /LENGTH=391 /DNA_ID=CAMNT_0008577605 /DNA_START=63 /DNA_END=1238 /DNA_ORIENTATION=+